MRKSAIGAAIAAAVMAMPAAAVQAVDTRAAEYRELVEKVRADMFRAGEPVARWDRGGVDPDSVLRAAGSDRYFYQMEKAGGVREVALLTDRPIAAIAPEHWRAIASYGSPAARAENAVVQFMLLDSRHVMAVRAGSWRRKDVDCIKGIAHAILYERPGAPVRSGEGVPPELLFRVSLDAAAGQTVCSRYDGDRQTGWEVRHFLPNGRAIGEKHLSRMRIVPAAPLDTLMSTGD